MPTQNTPNPNCRVCSGTGTDDAFGSTCTECWVDAERDQIIAARYQGVQTLPSDRAYTPGERMDGRTFGSGASSLTASDKQINYLAMLHTRAASMPLSEGDAKIVAQVEHALSTGMVAKRAASEFIDALRTITSRPAGSRLATPATTTEHRTNRYGGRCVECGSQVEAGAGFIRKNDADRWVTFHGTCPAAPAAPADGYEPERGHVHVIDGEFYRVHVAQRSGRPYAVKAIVLRTAEWGTDDEGNRVVLVPGEVEWNYEQGRGKVTQMTGATRITAEQAKAFGEMVGRCMFCSHAIDTPESVTAGYGPVCATKNGLPWG